MYNNYLDKNILICGPNGMIGSACVKFLKENKFTNIFHPTRNEIDYTNKENILDYLLKNKIDYAICAIGKVGGIIENKTIPADFIDQNVISHLNFMWAANKSNIKRCIFFGSSCMYPREDNNEITENMLLNGKLEETSIAYATSKICIYQSAVAYNKQYKNPNRFVIVIPNSTYGPNDNFDPKMSHVLSSLINKIHHAKVNNHDSITLWGTGNPKENLYIVMMLPVDVFIYFF